MNNPDDVVSTQSSNPAAALFEREWLTYRKMVDNNYTFHREAYGELRHCQTNFSGRLWLW